MPVSGVSQRSHSGSTTQTLNQGDHGPQVRELQQKLTSLGFNTGPADGDFGPRTEAAVKAFQHAHGLSADGVVGPKTRAALNKAEPGHASTPAPTHASTAPAANLSRGSSGSAVRQLQGDLNKLGYNTGTPDGQFGPKTESAVKKFQAHWGLTADGDYGPKTRAALNRALAGEHAPHPNATPGTGSTGGTGGVTHPGTGSAGRDALASAKTQVGVREATGNNDGTPSQRYAGGRQEPWCADFVAWNFRQTGHQLPGNQRMLASVQYMEDTMKQHGKFFARGSQTPQPGDIIFFRWNDGSRHVGMVESVSGGQVHTIEGNSGNAVSRRNYSLGYGCIAGYARP